MSLVFFGLLFLITKESDGVHTYVKRNNTQTYFCNYTSHSTGSAGLGYLFCVFHVLSFGEKFSYKMQINSSPL